MQATVLEIQRMSTEDGPGIRTTVFFKGCSLSCAWCHNPESIKMQPQVQWIGSSCIGCKICLESCPRGALSLAAEGVAVDREVCVGCGNCTEVCPTLAMELLGRRYTVDELFNELVKDRAYFEKSGGGITASGGEAALQADFVAELFRRLQAAGIHTALDSCGQVSWPQLEKILPHCDHLLFDLKEIDPQRHKDFTGQDNQLVLENFRRLTAWLAANPRKLWLRTPIIPGATDRADNIAGLAALLADLPPGLVERWELCAFNNLCKDKYSRLGLEWKFADTQLMSAAELDALVAAAGGLDYLCWSGSTRMINEEEK